MANEYRLPEEIQSRLNKLEEDKARLEVLLAEKEREHAELTAGDEVRPGVYRHVIDLPASGGIAIVINGTQYFHGQAYEFSRDELAGILDMEHRSWAHEREVKGNGSFENAYRPKMNTVLSMRGTR